MLRSPMAEETAFRTESNPGMARSATSAPRSAGCSYARELMSGNRMRPRRAGSDSVVMPSSVRGEVGLRSAHLEDAADESHGQLEDESKHEPRGADDDASEGLAVLEAVAPRDDQGHDAQDEPDGRGTRNDSQDEPDEPES